MVAAAIDAVLIPQAARLVADYYDERRAFAAATFETLGDNDPYRVRPDDLLAITLLDVSASPLGVRQILGAQAKDLAEALSRVPVGVPLWEATDANLSDAEAVWALLRSINSINSVIAGKLLARKRPALIPVIDKWVIKALAAPGGRYWAPMRDALTDADRRGRIEALRGDVPLSVSTLRLLDVVIWMQFSESTGARESRLRAGLPVRPRPPRRGVT